MRIRNQWTILALCFISAGLTFIDRAIAGPPFRTDDPEPVEEHHWEIYVASQLAHDRDALSGTAPHLEVNNGPLPNLQLHVIVPLAYTEPQGGPLYAGIGDVELGAKYRFVEETSAVPQVGTFPLVEIPTGNQTRALGNGRLQLFLPLWIQKSWGDWSSYGGGGYWHNPGPGNRDYWFGGWEVQRSIFATFTVGGEVTYSGASTVDGRAQTAFNVGAMLDLSEEHHLLFSAGRDLSGQNLMSMYIAFQWTLGPHEERS